MLGLIVVIYNQPVGKWQPEEGMTRVVADNSDDAALRAANAAACQAQDVLYLDMGGNCGLPCAYNRALNVLLNAGAEWIALLDQDTQTPPEYYAALQKLDAQNGWIQAPEVRTPQTVLSPRWFSRDRLHQHLKGYPGAWRSAVNAGLVIHWSVFERFGRYDEQLFLDWVDYDFLLTIYEQDSEFHIGTFPAVLGQDFSGEAVRPGDRRRFRIYLHDLEYFVRKHHLSRLAQWNLRLRRAAHLALAHRNPEYFFMQGGIS